MTYLALIHLFICSQNIACNGRIINFRGFPGFNSSSPIETGDRLFNGTHRVPLAFCLPLIMKLPRNIPLYQARRPSSFSVFWSDIPARIMLVLSSSSSLFLSPPSLFLIVLPTDLILCRPFSPRRRDIENLIPLMARTCYWTRNIREIRRLFWTADARLC